MELLQALETRYSCRAYTPEAPTPEQIEAVLEAGRLAPTARNNQPVRLWVATGAENLAKIDICTGCRYGAQVVFILGYDVDEACTHVWGSPEDAWSFGPIDTTSVLVHMALRATDLGLATCWLGAFDGDKVHELFGIPANIRIRALLDLGTPAEGRGEPSPRHTDRKPLSETVAWL